MKLTFKNLWVQLLSWLLLALTFSGLNVIPDEVAARIFEHISNNDFFALVIYVVGNLGNVFWHWGKQLKEDPKMFWAFVESINFWLGAVNIIVGLAFLIGGIDLDPESLKEFITMLFNKEYWGAAGVFFMNILIPILKGVIGRDKRKPEVIELAAVKAELAKLKRA